MQTTYTYQKAAGLVAGQVTKTDGQTIEAMTVPTGGIAFGVIVDLDVAATPDSDNLKNTLKAHVTDAMPFGITIYDGSKPPGGWLAGETAAVIRRGRVWMVGTGTVGSAHPQIPGSMIRELGKAEDGTVDICEVEFSLPSVPAA